MAEKPKVISTLRARGGVIVHAMRYVLMVSIALAVVAMVWVYLAAPKPSPATVPAASGSR
jgi:hypothetical protein